MVDGAAPPTIVVGASAWPTIELAMAEADGVNVRRSPRIVDLLGRINAARPGAFEVSVLDVFDDVAADPSRVGEMADLGVDRLVLGVSVPHDPARLRRDWNCAEKRCQLVHATLCEPALPSPVMTSSRRILPASVVLALILTACGGSDSSSDTTVEDVVTSEAETESTEVFTETTETDTTVAAPVETQPAETSAPDTEPAETAPPATDATRGWRHRADHRRRSRGAGSRCCGFARRMGG